MQIGIQSACVKYDYTWNPPSMEDTGKSLLKTLYLKGKMGLIAEESPADGFRVGCCHFLSGIKDIRQRDILFHVVFTHLTEKEARSLCLVYLMNKESMEKILRECIFYTPDSWYIIDNKITRKLKEIISTLNIQNSYSYLEPCLVFQHDSSQKSYLGIIELLSSNSFSSGYGVKLLISDIMQINQESWSRADIISFLGVPGKPPKKMSFSIDEDKGIKSKDIIKDIEKLKDDVISLAKPIVKEVALKVSKAKDSATKKIEALLPVRVCKKRDIPDHGNSFIRKENTHSQDQEK